MTAKAKTHTFESAYRSLEALVNEIESRELGLEEGIAKFEQGLILAQFCKQRLTEAEHKIVMIKNTFGSLMAPDDDMVDPVEEMGPPGEGEEDNDDESEEEESI